MKLVKAVTSIQLGKRPFNFFADSVKCWSTTAISTLKASELLACRVQIKLGSEKAKCYKFVESYKFTVTSNNNHALSPKFFYSGIQHKIKLSSWIMKLSPLQIFCPWTLKLSPPRAWFYGTSRNQIQILAYYLSKCAFFDIIDHVVTCERPLII